VRSKLCNKLRMCRYVCLHRQTKAIVCQLQVEHRHEGLAWVTKGLVCSESNEQASIVPDSVYTTFNS